MKDWVAMQGDFVSCGEEIIYQGGLFVPTDSDSNDIAYGKAGILLFEDILSNGKIEADIMFDSFDVGDEAEILFSYQDHVNFMCAGVTNSPAKYEFKSISASPGQIGQWSYLKLAGFTSEPASNKYHLRLCLLGSSVELYINNIKVLSAVSNVPVQKTNVGMWVRSKSTIRISNFRAQYQKPSAFIVSQFGEDYDVLYHEVIRPICEKMKYNPIRGDEVTTCTMILDDIVASIKNAAVIIADITQDNPNVFYEIGYAHAINKPTILLCESSYRDKLPFDISGFRTIFYDNTIGGKKQIEQKLEEHLRAFDDNPLFAGS